MVIAPRHVRTCLTASARIAAAIVAAFCLLVPVSPVAAQGIGRISGTVTDSISGRLLSDVQISVVGTRAGAVTDARGRYNLVGIPVGVRVVEARRIGYQPAVVRNVTVAANATATVDIKLREVALTLQAVVTTGLVDPTSGTRVPFTVSKVENTALAVPAANALESIQGKVAGVTVVPMGQPGSGTNIILRAPTSINKGNAPLVVVDGVIQSQAFGAASADLDAADIESIEVIKGASAASLYGSRAASGVIQIRTKRGTGTGEAATRYQFRSEVGMNSLGGKMGWARYHYYQTDASGQYVNAAGQVVQRAQRVARPVWQRFQDVKYADKIYDPVDEFFDPGQTYKNYLNIAQSSARTNWFLSLGSSKEDGVVLSKGAYDQRDLRFNLDHTPMDQLKISFSAYHSRTQRQELYGDTFFDLINQAPDANLLVPDPDGTPYLYQPDPEGREENPLYVLATEDRNRDRARTQGSLSVRYTPLDWLTFDAAVSYDRSDRRLNFFLDQGKKTEGYATGGIGNIEQFAGTTNTINSEASANLMRKFGALTVKSTGRVLLESEKNETTTANGQDFAVPGVKSLNNAKTRFVESAVETIKASGYFVTLGGDYAGKYIGDGLIRRDGSSLFGENERWNSYYRLSGAWRVGEERWWPWKTTLNEFKLRASRGTAGGRPNFADQYETYSFTSAGGVTKQNLGNKNLKPENSTETEIGVDAIIRERFGVQLSYAKTITTDQLIQIPLAGFYGYGQQWQNAGTVEGNSIEASIEAQLIKKPTFQWKASLVVDRSRNEITAFDRTCFVTQTIGYRCKGASLHDMYGFQFLRDAAYLPADVQSSAKQFVKNDEGLLVWVGLDGAGNPKQYTQGEVATGGWGTTATIGTSSFSWGMPILRRDATGSAAVLKMGNGLPDFKWGISSNMSWRNLEFITLIDAAVGGDAYNQTNQRMYQWAKSRDVDQTGKEQELKKPVEYYIALYSAADPTDYFVEDAGFVKLREVALRYRLTGRMLGYLQTAGARGVTLSLIGRNLYTITNYKGYDPEVGTNALTRIDSFDYPRYRTITGSIEITF
ncbi:MAG: SusC/RagA family TonB-linked outer membrane protein [Gemmatimonadetes bacterium]|nr:SusC/RagA family TonB-linked outer membrane protein [Gemmatimonadota bacterium]